MNASAPTILPLFSVPFGLVALSDADALNPELLQRFEPNGSAALRSQPVNPLLHRGQDDLVASTDPPVQRLMVGMMQGVRDVAGALNEFSPEQWRTFVPQSRAWFCVIEPDGCIAATHYAMCAWCAVYCVTAPEPAPTRQDSGQLRLYESRLGNMFQDASTAAMKVPYRRGHYSWRPVAGRMAVFPASLLHEVALNRAAGRLVLVTMQVRFMAPSESRFTQW